MDKHQLRNFYIPEEQSVYLLNANDAEKAQRLGGALYL